MQKRLETNVPYNMGRLKCMKLEREGAMKHKLN